MVLGQQWIYLLAFSLLVENHNIILHVLWSDVCYNRPSVLVILIKDGDVSLLLSNVAINDLRTSVMSTQEQAAGGELIWRPTPSASSTLVLIL